MIQGYTSNKQPKITPNIDIDDTSRKSVGKSYQIGRRNKTETFQAIDVYGKNMCLIDFYLKRFVSF